MSNQFLLGKRVAEYDPWTIPIVPRGVEHRSLSVGLMKDTEKAVIPLAEKEWDFHQVIISCRKPRRRKTDRLVLVTISMLWF
jgi:hypothetical protein